MLRKSQLFTLLIILCSTLALYAWSIKPQQPHPQVSTSESVARDSLSLLQQAKEKARSLMEGMTQEEKLAQLIMPMVWPKEDATSLKEWEQLVAKGFGGVLWQKGTPDAVLRLTNRMRERASIPMLTAMDGEWGLSMRLSGTIRWPRNVLLGAADDTDLSYRYGIATAREAELLGIQVNFAPVADVNSNPLNPVIGTRSFGSNPTRVAQQVLAYARGLRKGGILPVAKHFPGHGDTHLDSHKALPIIQKSRAELEASELIPFEQYIQAELGGIMTAHLTIPALDASGLPASASPRITTELLQKELGFSGLIFTDGLGMQGIQKGVQGSVAVATFRAGNDILLAPNNPYQALAELQQAAKEGVLTAEAIDARCLKVLTWKLMLGSMNREKLPLEGLQAKLHATESQRLHEEIYQKAMTLLKTPEGTARQAFKHQGKVALLRWGNQRCGTLLQQLTAEGAIDAFSLTAKASNATIQQTCQQLQAYDQILVAVTSPQMKEHPALTRLAKQKTLSLLFFTSPYTLLQFQESIPIAKAVALAYDATTTAQRALADALRGIRPFMGKLPMELPQLFPEGHTAADSLVSAPAEAKPQTIDPANALSRAIDAIAEEGVTEGAYPGCQVLVAHKGKILYHKAFGYKDAARKEPNNLSTLYDLASVTKAVATTPLLMIAKDEKRLRVTERIGNYLPYLKGSDKEPIRISDLLFHTAGLPAILRFYFLLIDKESYTSPLISYRARKGFPIRFAKQGWARKGWTYRPDMLQEEASSQFPTRFAEGMYLHHSVQDSIQERIRNANLRKRGYRYSDIDFLILQDLLEEIYQTPLDQLFQEKLATPLGLQRLLFKPLAVYPSSEIATGQQDHFLRQQILRGDVDDEAAAMRGGVSGNAGLFGTAGELYKILQLLLNQGFYNGQQLIQATTVREFTTAKHPSSPYALGFDRKRPNGRGSVCTEAAPTTYGHTGFTGTCFWIDPEAEVIYIFLSNRISPTRWNPKLSSLGTRKRIQSTIYQYL